LLFVVSPVKIDTAPLEIDLVESNFGDFPFARAGVVLDHEREPSVGGRGVAN